MFAAGNGRPAVLGRLLQAGAGVGDRGLDGVTALMLAAARGHVEVVDALLAAGARAGETDASGATALSFAEKAGHAGVAKRLEAWMEENGKERERKGREGSEQPEVGGEEAEVVQSSGALPPQGEQPAAEGGGNERPSERSGGKVDDADVRTDGQQGQAAVAPTAAGAEEEGH